MIKRHFRRYNMPKQAANDTLKNVLEACNMETENINFELLIIKSIAQTNLVDSCKWIALGFLFLVLVSPIALMNRDIKVESSGIVENIIIEDHHLYSDHFTLKLIGNDLDYEGIYASEPDGSVVFPTDINRETGIVTFPYSHESMVIHVSDKNGHTLSATLSAYEP